MLRRTAFVVTLTLAVAIESSGEGQGTSVPASMPLFEVDVRPIEPILSRWTTALRINANEAPKVRTAEAHERWDRDGWAFVRYRATGDMTVTKSPEKYAGIPGMRFALSDDEIAGTARSFLSNNSLLESDRGRDEFVFERVMHVVDETVDTATGRRTEVINTGIALFARRLDGFDAIGPGAHVAVYVGADRKVTGADVAWRTLRQIGTVRPEDPREVLRTRDNASLRIGSEFKVGYYFGDRATRELVIPVTWTQVEHANGTDTLIVPLVVDADVLRRTAFASRPYITVARQ